MDPSHFVEILKNLIIYYKTFFFSMNSSSSFFLSLLSSEFRKILLQMGFEEMPTNRYVESSFWNFDALFQPQQHPAR